MELVYCSIDRATEEASMEVGFSINGVQREREGGRCGGRRRLTGGPQMAVRQRKERRWAGLLGLPDVQRWAAQPRKERKSAGGEAGLTRLSPRRDRETFFIFPFCKYTFRVKNSNPFHFK